MTINECKRDGCHAPVRGRGYCAGHYSTARSAGEFATEACVSDGCTRLATSTRGLCNACHQKWLRINRSDLPECMVDGCGRVQYTSGGYCRMHYQRVQRNGEPGPASSGWDRRGQGSIVGGYRRFKRGGKVILEHREIMEQVLGRPLERHETVHHINGDRLDNRPENLQLRSGRHGKGVAHECLDCGSTNIGSRPL